MRITVRKKAFLVVTSTRLFASAFGKVCFWTYLRKIMREIMAVMNTSAVVIMRHINSCCIRRYLFKVF
ncbi:MAG TPA: hypothetical protein DCM31_09875 [Deferribacteraceae bacterium]|nr:hypothetical protein [Deferribacteraceae bacterium]